MILIGFAAGLFVAERRRSLYRLRADVVLAAYFLAGIGAFLGGKLFFVIQGFGSFLELHARDGLSFFTYFSQAGLVFYGGMAGTLGGIFLAAPALQEKPWPLMDTLLPSLPLAQAFGRVGCLLAGCCYGIPVSWGLWMDAASGAPADSPLLPVQLFEAAGCLVLFICLLHLGRTKRPRGYLLSIYLLGYSALRFGLEFLRYDAIRGSIGVLSVSQWCSIAAALCGLLLLRHARSGASEAREESVRSL